MITENRRFGGDEHLAVVTGILPVVPNRQAVRRFTGASNQQK